MLVLRHIARCNDYDLGYRESGMLIYVSGNLHPRIRHFPPSFQATVSPSVWGEKDVVLTKP